MAAAKRLDTSLIQLGKAKDQREAFVLVTSGHVFVNGQKAVSPSQLVGDGDAVEIRPGRRFVGRGAEKLEAAIREFGVDVRGKVCADVGAATGGFTEVLLRRGAARVYAIDAGRGKLDMKLREDPRVVVREGTSVLTMAPPPESMEVVTVDVSFTSLRSVLPVIRRWLAAEGSVFVLFKPQYEVMDPSFLRHGVLRDEKTRRELVERFRAWLREHDWQELGFMESPIRGSEGNVEYLFHLAPA